MAIQVGRHKYHALPVDDDDDDDESFEKDVERDSPVSTQWTPQRYWFWTTMGIFTVISIFYVLAWALTVSYRNDAVYQREPLRFTSEGTFQISVVDWSV